jgi:hypothetical protein
VARAEVEVAGAVDADVVAVLDGLTLVVGLQDRHLAVDEHLHQYQRVIAEEDAAVGEQV